MANEVLKRKGLPSIITHPAITGAKYTGYVTPPKEETEEGRMKRVAGMAGIKPTGLIEKETTVPAVETKKELAVSPVKTEVKVTPKTEVSLPYRYEKDVTGKVYTESDLPTQQELAGGGFGYVPGGLPEAGVDLKTFYMDTMGKLTDRASRLADRIEAGFLEGKRLTTAIDELTVLQNSILSMGTTLQGIEVAGTEAAYKTALIKKAEKETGIIYETPEEATEAAERIAKAGITPSKGLVDIGYTEYVKGRRELQTKSEYILASPEEQRKMLSNYDANYPKYSGAITGGEPKKYKRDAEGNVYIEE